MAKREYETDEQIENEIKQLRKSPYVRLCEKERRIKYARRQYLYQLRYAEKVGMKLAEQGYTLENIEELMLADMESEDTEE